MILNEIINLNILSSHWHIALNNWEPSLLTVIIIIIIIIEAVRVCSLLLKFYVFGITRILEL